MQLRRSQQGFTPVHIIMVVVLVIVIGLAGWRIWDAKSSEKKAAPTPTEAAEETAVTKANYVRPASKNYQVVLPEGWVSGSCADSADTLFLAPTNNKLGTCNSESSGTLLVTRSDGNTGYGADYYAANPYYGGVVYTPMTVDGITGYKITYTVATAEGIGPPIGTKAVEYYFFDGTDTYTIVYTQLAADADLSAQAQAVAESFDKL